MDDPPPEILKLEVSAFDLEKYQLDRAHELELNRFTHTLEVERLKLLIILNGGAAAAWLTFSKAESGGVPDGSALAPLLAAAIPWLVGLGFASLATEAALKTQRAFTKAYHKRRRADEWRTMLKVRSPSEVSLILPRWDKKAEVGTDVAGYTCMANEAMKEGEAAADCVKLWTLLSLAAFIAGAIGAAFGIGWTNSTLPQSPAVIESPAIAPDLPAKIPSR